MNRPRLRTEGSLVPGLAAVGLFVVFAAAFVTEAFPDPAGFGENAALMKSLGSALMSIDPEAIVTDGTPVPSEGFVVSLIIVAVALDAALDGSLMLARREESSESVTLDTDTTGSEESVSRAADGGRTTDGGAN